MSLTRRSFLRLLGIGAVVGPALLKAAIKPEPRLPAKFFNEHFRRISNPDMVPDYPWLKDGYDGPLTASEINWRKRTLNGRYVEFLKPIS